MDGRAFGIMAAKNRSQAHEINAKSDEVARLRSQNTALRERLRHHVIQKQSVEMPNGFEVRWVCAECGGSWKQKRPEAHRAGCAAVLP